ncbi:MAG: oligosaccharide flippase family protein [Steroidobacteraceae bacterium]
MITRLLKSDSLRSAIGFAAGGAGFAAGNILLAKVLSPEGFGVVALVLALNQVGVTFGPFGLEIVANRHRPRVGRRLGLLALAFATATGIVAAVIAFFYYGLAAGIAALLLPMVMGSATGRVCSALFQGERQFRFAMILSQASNYILLCVACVALGSSLASDSFVLIVMAAGYAIASGLGWLVAYRTVNNERREIQFSVAFSEGAAALGIGVGVEILSQFERLAIPKVGSVAMLGTYAVLAAVAGSPFRMIRIATSFSLLPRLRAVASAAEARAVIARESLTALLMAAASTIVIVLVAPLVFNTLLKGKYEIGLSLIGATIVVGLAKIWESFSTSVTMACGTPPSMLIISVLAWICLAIAAGAMVIGARYGLLGIVYSVGSAWVLLAAGGSYLAVVSLRRRFPSAPASAG